MKNWINGALATFRFELTRSFSLQRLLSVLGLILFPPVVLWVFIIGALRTSLAGEALEFVLFTLIFLVGLVCLLSLLLSAAPNVQGELEGKTWSFIAMRPGRKDRELSRKVHVGGRRVVPDVLLFANACVC